MDLQKRFLRKSKAGPVRADSPPARTNLLDDDEARDLVRDAQRRDRRALARLYQLYADRIFRYIYYRLGERARAEELTGELLSGFSKALAIFV